MSEPFPKEPIAPLEERYVDADRVRRIDERHGGGEQQDREQRDVAIEQSSRQAMHQ